MIIVKLWHYIRGYVIINIKGRHLERLINLIHHNNILIWDIFRISSEEISAKIELRDYKKVSELSDQLSCTIKIIRKSGMTLWKWRVKTRKIFVITSFLVLLAIYFMSSLVLTVDVIGNITVDKNEIIEDIASRGLKPWKLKATIDIEEIKTSFLNDYKNFEYIDIEFNGTKAIVDLVETKKIEKIYDKSLPVDLIAEKDAIIKDILVINGTANVEVNQEVKKGDLLVKGEIITSKPNDEGEEISISQIHAKAKVMGLVDYTEKYDIRKYKIIDEDSYKINRVIHIGDLVINFLDSDENYYYHSSEEINLHIFDFKLPIKVNKIKYYEKENCINKSKEELEEEVQEKVKKKYREIGQVQDIQIVSIQEENNINKYEVKIHVLEEISEEQLLD